MQVTRAALVGQLASYDAQARRVPEMQRKLIGLQRNLEVNQGVYTYLMTKKAETSIQKAATVSDNKILDVAGLAVDPYWPNKIILLILVLFLTFATPTGYLLARNILQTKVMSRNDIARFTALPVIGVVGHNPDVKHENVLLNNPASSVAESFRMIRTALQLMESNAGKKVILVTSSVGNEGKSFVALNLASALALQKNRVVLVSMNLHRPKWYTDFEYRNSNGVTDFLEGKAGVDQIIQKTGLSQLDLISGGSDSSTPAELMGTSAVKDLLEELKKRYDYIVLDAAPLGIVADTYLLLQHSEINIYVFREGMSQLEYVNTLDEVCAEKEIPNMYLVLNDSFFSVANGYGHNYAYAQRGNGYYDSERTRIQLLLSKIRLRRKSAT
jgi:capsular exopolysaccharide synthesis family protein